MGERVVIPFSKRPLDWVFVFFYTINLFFITYIVDVEQLVISDPAKFEYPLWPPKPMVDLIHWYGGRYDPPLMAREPWWRMTIWLDSLIFGPYYVFALYAFIKGKEWIRIPAVFQSGILFANVCIILHEEMLGPHKTSHPAMVLALNAPWLLLPIFTTIRMWLCKHPFTAPAKKKAL
eukprot:TRINITY_DN3083_c0_g1_i1.p1 TRINITY_DN3083_c0_g1~~TRINITY_DN3083_c0_g1_i1.p1  ORF type:complete len:177 (-),score=38.99 TRINITY_DN3083_c0_g1_i1:59-589(-)